MTSTITTTATGSTPPPVPTWAARIRAWCFEPAPLARIAPLRVAIYLFVIYDLFFVVNDVFAHADSSPVLYRPIRMREWFALPVPEHDYVHLLRWVLIIGCLLLVSGRLPGRLGVLVGFVVAAGFTDWVSIGMSYSKIDHDHFALIVAVWVLPTIGVARFRDRTRSEAAGWALLCIQVGCVAVYFLSAISKFRFGGLDWPTGSTFAWAITRRGTGLGDLLLDPPWILTASQFLIIALELITPLLLVLRRWPRYLFVIGLCGFHLSTYLTLKIHFLPLVICLLAFLPLERIQLPARVRRIPAWARGIPARVRGSRADPAGNRVGQT
jgi:hypothetical protein